MLNATRKIYKFSFRTIVLTGWMLFFIFSISTPLNACRLWASIAHSGYTLFSADSLSFGGIYTELEEFQLQGGCRENSWPYNNHNGWAMIYYTESEQDSLYQLYRSAEPAEYDSVQYRQFTSRMLARDRMSYIGIGHVRKASSGATDIPDPHPFIMELGGETFAMVHNGNVDKTILIDLITDYGQDLSWLEEHPPQTYDNGSWQDDNGWQYVVDSELLFLWIMKNIRDEDGDVFHGLLTSLSILENECPTGKKNIIFSDGVDIFAYCSTRSSILDLYYAGSTIENGGFDNDSYYFSVMSTPPGVNDPVDWIQIPNRTMVRLSRTGIQEYGNFPDRNITAGAQNDLRICRYIQNFPNPFNSTTTIIFDLIKMSYINCNIYDLNGRLVTRMANELFPSGRHIFTWEPQSAVSGIYLVRLEVENQVFTQKIINLK